MAEFPNIGVSRCADKWLKYCRANNQPITRERLVGWLKREKPAKAPKSQDVGVVLDRCVHGDRFYELTDEQQQSYRVLVEKHKEVLANMPVFAPGKQRDAKVCAWLRQNIPGDYDAVLFFFAASFEVTDGGINLYHPDKYEFGGDEEESQLGIAGSKYVAYSQKCSCHRLKGSKRLK